MEDAGRSRRRPRRGGRGGDRARGDACSADVHLAGRDGDLGARSLIASDLELSPKLIGVFVGIIYVGSMAGSLAAGGFVERFGAIRVSQACVLMCAVSLAAVCAGGRAAVAARRAARLAPLVARAGLRTDHARVVACPRSHCAASRGWRSPSRSSRPVSRRARRWPAPCCRGSRWSKAGVRPISPSPRSASCIAVVAQPTRSALDADRKPARPISLAGVFAPLGIVLRTPALTELALTGFVYAATQVCLASFLVIYLTETLHFGIVAAGLALTVANIGGIVGRIVWGGIADRWVPPRMLLGIDRRRGRVVRLRDGNIRRRRGQFRPSLSCALFLARPRSGGTASSWPRLRADRQRARLGP